MPESILSRYDIGAVSDVRPLGRGIVNATYLVSAAAGMYVLQRLNGAFDSGVMTAVERITEHLAKRGFETQRVVRTANGELLAEAADGRWRLMTFVPGHVLERDPSPEEAHSAGALVGRFHTTLQEVRIGSIRALPGFHDTNRAIERMSAVDRSRAGEPLHTDAHPLVEAIGERYSRHAHDLWHYPRHLLHGDLKLTNIVFDDDGAHAIIDLDTVGEYTIPIELGDMLRNWCRVRELGKPVRFDGRVWDAALAGYSAEAAFLTGAERSAIPDGFRMITLELAARYAADAYERSYFSFRPADGPHEKQALARARACLELFDDFTSRHSAGA